MSESTTYERQMLHRLGEEARLLHGIDADRVDNQLSYIRSIFDSAGEVIRAPAVRLLRDAAASHNHPAVRAAISAMADTLASAPARPTGEPKAPAPAATRAEVSIGTMVPGRRYRVMQTFTDFDGDVLEAGTVLTFREYSYFPYDGGYTIRFDEQVVRLAEIDGANAQVIDNAGNAWIETVTD